MREKIKVMIATYQNISLTAAEARKVRGFFADRDHTDHNLHNHTLEGDSVYQYPLVQYKVLNRHPVIVAMEDGIRSIHPHLMEATELKIGENVYTDMALDIRLVQPPIGDSKTMESYCFVTPWLALNQKNFEKYEAMDKEEQDAFLGRILIGNILSLCKRFGVTIEQKLQVTHQLKAVSVFYKEKRMIAFTGKFQANCCIPNLCGIGKGTARGFGTVKVTNEKEGDEHDS